MQCPELLTGLGLYPFCSVPWQGNNSGIKGKFETVTKSLNNSAICISPSKSKEQRSIVYHPEPEQLQTSHFPYKYYQQVTLIECITDQVPVRWFTYIVIFYFNPLLLRPLPRQISTDKRLEDDVNRTCFAVLQCYPCNILYGPDPYSSVLSAINSKSHSQVLSFLCKLHL